MKKKNIRLMCFRCKSENVVRDATAEALDNDPQFVKEYHRDLKEELKFHALDKNGDEMVEDDSVMHENKQYKIAYMKFCSDLMDEYVMLTLEDSDGNMKEAVDSDVILVQNH